MHSASMLLLPLMLIGASAGPVSKSRVQFAGVQLPGLALDASIFGSAFNTFESTACNATYTAAAVVDPAWHYRKWRAAGFNMFRVPIGWQHAQSTLNGPLNETSMAELDKIFNMVTNEGGVAILDIHNYARWYCSVINQPEYSFPVPSVEVTDEHFVDLWTKLAQRYANNTNILFQLMNEPHDLNITVWGMTMQKVIYAIRNVTMGHQIMVSGTQYARLSDWQESSSWGIGPGLLTDPAKKLLYDFHQYFDDEAGALGLCEPWRVFSPAFNSVTGLLRKAGYRAILSEFGGRPFPQCVSLFNNLLDFLDSNADVWYGWTAWGNYVPGALTLSLNVSSPNYLLTKILIEHAPGKA